MSYEHYEQGWQKGLAVGEGTIQLTKEVLLSPFGKVTSTEYQEFLKGFNEGYDKAKKQIPNQSQERMNKTHSSPSHAPPSQERNDYKTSNVETQNEIPLEP